jgi:superfamily II DNA or RNA helicase
MTERDQPAVDISEGELRYHPVVGDIESLVRNDAVRRLLVVGTSVPRGVDHRRTQVRLSSTEEPGLASGLYWFRLDQEVAVLTVDGPVAPGSPTRATWDAPDHDPLINAYGWWCEWWDDAVEVPAPAFDIGDDVVTVPDGQEAKIRGRRFVASTWNYVVRVEGRTVNLGESKLTRPDIDDDPDDWTRRPPGDARRFAATLTRAKLGHELTDTVFSFRATRTIFRPYQFRPVIRLLETGRLRLLIADEVGLGKTIEAGLVWTELDARRLANRVLVVCPSMLVPKWRREMEERFNFELTELDREGLDDLLERVESDRLPGRFHTVCSIERIRVWSGLDRLAELAPRFDLVIVDEAHIFRNAGTKSNALGALLSDWADALVFLSATPLNLGNADLYNLLELLAPGEFDDPAVLEARLAPNAVLNRVATSLLDRQITNVARVGWLAELGGLTFGAAIVGRPEFADLVRLLSNDGLTHSEIAEAKRLVASLHALSAVVTRTRKVEVEDRKAMREARPIEVEWTDEEAEFYVAFEQWQRERARRRGMPVGFVTQMPLRLASTCLPAARQRVLDSNFEPGDDLDADARPPDETDVVDDDAPPPDVIDAARAIPDGCDSKFDAFLDPLLSIVGHGRQVIVFTFSRAALSYLEERLRSHVSLTVLHGGVVKADRENTMRRFRAGDYQVMLASRVASEGLDFEFCSAVVNYDLPWNPMEVEQRIGRIDRIGQTEDKVLILNFHTPGTIETDIIQRVHERIGVFTDSIGELEPILQSAMSDLKRAMLDFELSPDQRDRRIDEVLTAIEERRQTLDEVENATSYLTSTDQVEIDGLEDDLLANGRYVGQPELVLLVQDWAQRDPNARCSVSDDGLRLTVRGTAGLAADLIGVQAAGERSALELDSIARRLRDEHDLVLSLDQESARVTGLPLLSATHPLVRAALRVPGHRQLRFADLTITTSDVPEGEYLVLFSLARWTGARPSTELWTAAVDTGSRSRKPNTAVGAAVLASLAGAEINDGRSQRPRNDLAQHVDVVIEHMLERQNTEEQTRLEANDALIETRRISLEETHKRKCQQIERRITTARARGNTSVIRMFDGQLATQARLLAEEVARLDAQRQGAMEVEHLAVATVTVGAY